MMSRAINIQQVSQTATVPDQVEIRDWVKAALDPMPKHVDLTIRIIDELEAKQLNLQYRQKDYATNVLSFPYERDQKNLVGDIVLCAPVIAREASEQNCTHQQHWAHLVVHGVLHLLGYDHEIESDALIMQHKEMKILKKIGYSHPDAEEM